MIPSIAVQRAAIMSDDASFIFRGPSRSQSFFPKNPNTFKAVFRNRTWRTLLAMVRLVDRLLVVVVIAERLHL